MKKILTLIVLFANFIGNAQCPAPSNLTLSIPYATAAELTWQVTGTANSWEIAIIQDFYVGAPVPLNGLYVTESNTYTIPGLPPAYGCYVFFVRSVCPATGVSSWAAIGSLGCSTNVYNYLATLSNDSFPLNLDNSELQIFPNPAKNILNIIAKQEINITSVSIYNILGQLVLLVEKSTNAIDVSNLKTGNYFVRVNSDKGISSGKFIKE